MACHIFNCKVMVMVMERVMEMVMEMVIVFVRWLKNIPIYFLSKLSICFGTNRPLMISRLLPSTEPSVPSSAMKNYRHTHIHGDQFDL